MGFKVRSRPAVPRLTPNWSELVAAAEVARSRGTFRFAQRVLALYQSGRFDALLLRELLRVLRGSEAEEKLGNIVAALAHFAVVNESLSSFSDYAAAGRTHALEKDIWATHRDLVAHIAMLAEANELVEREPSIHDALRQVWVQHFRSSLEPFLDVVRRTSP